MRHGFAYEALKNLKQKKCTIDDNLEISSLMLTIKILQNMIGFSISLMASIIRLEKVQRGNHNRCMTRDNVKINPL